ncbi:zinc transporter ZIP5 isoform X2 [Psammomys obesus]|uniref:zinc transporter ZIP5 isoform X2 n=1 Tax=Psammomys obesus TaxID=48139 RepID=UPI0024531C77|nr:zinc transporter ZIP5 isoform X2 [Psammomys obesus]
MGPSVHHLLAGVCMAVVLGWVGGSVPNLGPAEQEQNHYLAQLFGQYGENGTLTAGGLARLLHSLGLGRVQGLRLGHHEPPTGRAAPSSGDNFTHRLQEPELSVDVWAGMPLGPSGWDDREKSNAPDLPHGPGPSGLDLFHRLLLLDHSLADHLNEDCLNGSQLLVNFGLSPVAPLTPHQFALLCPALLYQIDSRVCIKTPATAPPGDILPALLHSALAVLLLSFPAPLSLLLLRLLRPRVLRPVLSFLGALAVGTLCGDALLHLLPHAQGRRHTGPSEQPEEDLGPGLSVLGGLFLLFMLENMLGLVRRRGLRPRCCRSKRDLGEPNPDPEDGSGMVLRPLQAASGDFAMLLQAGLSFRRLLLLSLVSGALGLGGAALGVGLSLGPVPLTPWVFGVTAGVFLYVALVDMLPALLRDPEPQPVLHVVLQGLGLLLGGSLMFTIALLEEQLLPTAPDG